MTTDHDAERGELQSDLQRLFILSLDLLCVAGLDGYFKRVNPAFERVLGYSRAELTSRQFIDFVHEEDREKTLAEVASLAEGAPTVDFENRYRTRSGDYRWLAWRAAPMLDRELIYAVARDVTAQKRDQELMARQTEELARSNADLESFAHVASHDLRAPIRSILTLAGFVEEDLGESIPETTRAHLTELRRRALLMRGLTDDLLVFSQAGRESEPEAIDTSELVAEVAFLLDPPDGFEVATEGEMPRFRTHGGPLRQVLRNLVGNALKHHDRDAGRIMVTARDDGEWWEFSVADDGPGIPPDVRPRVVRALGPETAGGDLSRTGLGLAIVGRIVREMGGRIELEPVADDGQARGATFRFTWPKELEAET